MLASPTSSYSSHGMEYVFSLTFVAASEQSDSLLPEVLPLTVLAHFVPEGSTKGVLIGAVTWAEEVQ